MTVETRPVANWAGAKARWTEDGTELAIPLAGLVGPRQALSILSAMAQTLQQLEAGDLRVEVQQTVMEEGRAQRTASLTIVATDLWTVDPIDFRKAVETGISTGSTSYQIEAAADEEHMTQWMKTLKTAEPSQ